MLTFVRRTNLTRPCRMHQTVRNSAHGTAGGRSACFMKRSAQLTAAEPFSESHDRPDGFDDPKGPRSNQPGVDRRPRACDSKG